MNPIFLVLLKLLFFIENVRSVNVVDNGSMDFQGVYSQLCKTRQCLWKCCPEGLNVMGKFFDKTCQRPVWPNKYRDLDFSDLKLFNEKLVPIGKSLKDVYTLVPGAFLRGDYINRSFDYSLLAEHQYYLNEKGILLDIIPNAFVNKIEVNTSLFCVDYQLDGNLTVVSASFWTVLGQSFHDDNSRSAFFNIAGFMVSCFFLALVLVIYCLLPELHTLSGMILMAYVATMFCSFLFLAVIQMGVYSEGVCLGLSYAAYFFTLAVFCWMTVMSYDFWSLNCKHLYHGKRSQRSAISKFQIHCCFGFGVPLALTVFLAIVNHINLRHLPFFIKPNIPKQACFIAGGHKLLYLYIPMLILILANWMFFLLSSCSLWKDFRSTSVLDKEAKARGASLAHRSQKNRFFLYLKLSVIMGLNWILEVVSFFYPDWKFWYITDFYNMLIGLCIFLIFICNKKIYKKLVKKFKKRESVKSVMETEAF